MKGRNSVDRTGRSKKAPRHVRLYHWMMDTAAWKSLNGNQRAIYIEMAARYNGSNNGRIHFSAREAAAALHMSKATGARDLAVLVERGFIVATAPAPNAAMKSRRLMSCPEGRYGDGSDSTHAPERGQCPLWVISGH